MGSAQPLPLRPIGRWLRLPLGPSWFADRSLRRHGAGFLYRASQLLLLLHQAHETHLPSLERRVAKPDIQTMLDGQHDTDAKRRRNAMTSLEPARKFILKYPDYL
jgi:hypothetical protein